MKTKKQNALRILFILGLITGLTGTLSIAQENQDHEYQDLEDLQDASMRGIIEVYQIVSDYPDFKYRFEMQDGEVEDVIVENVDNSMDRKRLEVLLYDYKKNKQEMKGKATRTGIYYSVDREPEPEGGYRQLYNSIHNNINYPEMAEEFDVVGNIFVKFVVEPDGSVSMVRASEDVETNKEPLVKELKQEAIAAVEATSGQWEPGMVDGEPVASWAVLPVVFDIERYPLIPTMVH